MRLRTTAYAYETPYIYNHMMVLLLHVAIASTIKVHGICQNFTYYQVQVHVHVCDGCGEFTKVYAAGMPPLLVALLLLLYSYQSLETWQYLHVGMCLSGFLKSHEGVFSKYVTAWWEGINAKLKATAG